MIELFYRRPAAAPVSAPILRAGMELHWWRPARDGRPTGHFADRVNGAWFAMDLLGLFASRELAALIVTDAGVPVHRLLVTPRWYRFPDMAAGDLQTGALWTHPERRGQGLAELGMRGALDAFAGRYDNMWYIAEPDNRSSTRLAEKLGFALVGEGRRTAPLGLSPLGQFRLTKPAA